jgi:hypothetical protein
MPNSITLRNIFSLRLLGSECLVDRLGYEVMTQMPFPAGLITY